MGFDDALNKAKDFAGDNSEQVSQGIDGASDQIKERTPDQFDGGIDQAGDAARDQLGLGGDNNNE